MTLSNIKLQENRGEEEGLNLENLAALYEHHAHGFASQEEEELRLSSIPSNIPFPTLYRGQKAKGGDKKVKGWDNTLPRHGTYFKQSKRCAMLLSPLQFSRLAKHGAYIKQ